MLQRIKGVWEIVMFLIMNMGIRECTFFVCFYIILHLKIIKCWGVSSSIFIWPLSTSLHLYYLRLIYLHLWINKFESTLIRIFFIGTSYPSNNEESNLKASVIFPYDISRMILENVFEKNLIFNEMNGFILNQKQQESQNSP